MEEKEQKVCPWCEMGLVDEDDPTPISSEVIGDIILSLRQTASNPLPPNPPPMLVQMSVDFQFFAQILEDLLKKISGENR